MNYDSNAGKLRSGYSTMTSMAGGGGNAVRLKKIQYPFQDSSFNSTLTSRGGNGN